MKNKNWRTCSESYQDTLAKLQYLSQCGISTRIDSWNRIETCMTICFVIKYKIKWFFPGSSAGKESICNAGDPGSIPGSGSSPGEGIGYPLQYSWTSLVAQTIKNLPAMRETWIWSLVWEDLLEESMATHSSILSQRIPVDRGAWWATVHGTAKSRTWLSDQAHTWDKWEQNCFFNKDTGSIALSIWQK